MCVPSVIPPLDFGHCLFPLLFSFSIVITAGNMTQLAGFGAMPKMLPVQIVVQAGILGG